jgi:hypothetical protein
MNATRSVTRLVTAALLAGGAAMGLANGVHADNGGGTWCPGQPLPQAYNFQITPDGGLSMTGPVPDAVNWDMNVGRDCYPRMADNGNGTKTNSVVEGRPLPMNCGLFWCPVPPGTPAP